MLSTARIWSGTHMTRTSSKVTLWSGDDTRHPYMFSVFWAQNNLDPWPFPFYKSCANAFHPSAIRSANAIAIVRSGKFGPFQQCCFREKTHFMLDTAKLCDDTSCNVQKHPQQTLDIADLPQTTVLVWLDRTPTIRAHKIAKKVS